jgi:hypothetical protein
MQQQIVPRKREVAVSVCVTHHPKRAALLPYTLKVLEAADPLVVVDEKSEGCWPTRRRAWLSVPDWATHHLVIDDDLRFCEHFYEGVVRAATLGPPGVLSFYANRPQTKKWAPGDPTWVKVRYTQGPAVLLPRKVALRFVEWADASTGLALVDDYLLKTFSALNNISQWTCMPSLAEHGKPNDSLVLNRPGDRTSTRTADVFLGERRSALTVDFRFRPTG